jgi:hypothetical protein
VSDCLVNIELEDGGTFKVQRNTLCRASDYFRKALTGNFLETESKVLRLPGCSIDTFELILYWLCYSSLPNFAEDIITTHQQSTHFELCKLAFPLQTRLAKLWIQCDMLLMPALQNEATRRLEPLLLEYLVSHDAAYLACHATESSSPLRRLLVTVFIHKNFRAGHCLGYDSCLQYLDKFRDVPGLLPAVVLAIKPCPLPECLQIMCNVESHFQLNINDSLVSECD